MPFVSDINGGRQTLSGLIEQSRQCVFFTGAGMSTESGIPDFRSPGEIWSRMDPIEFDEFVADEATRLEDWRRRFEMNEQFTAAKPNSGHRTVAALAGRGKVAAVITQNIDGLHQRAGCAPEMVIELHGNATYGACLNCGSRHELDEVRAIIDRSGSSPRCDSCGDLVKSAVINFGQAMPVEAMEGALEFSESCDLFIVVGSSFGRPASRFPTVGCGAAGRTSSYN